MIGPELERHLGPDDLAAELRADVRAGLTATPKQLPPKWFYDARGSALFEEITRLPEYYPTRAERAVLNRYATEIARLTGAKVLIELGSGSSEKTRLLLDALRGHGSLGGFVPLDVSEPALREAVESLTAGYPGLDVYGVVGDFTRHLGHLPAGGARLVAFLGGTIGNLLPEQRARFLCDLRSALGLGEWLLLGTDLVKDPAVLVSAYDDAAGLTAEFNRNLLHRLNRELGADFEPEAFEHVAVWRADHEWIEMRLRARHAMRVRLPALDLTVEFAASEDLLTEISAKFRHEGVQKELTAGGFALRRWWTDPEGRFGVSLAETTLLSRPSLSSPHQPHQPHSPILET